VVKTADGPAGFKRVERVAACLTAGFGTGGLARGHGFALNAGRIRNGFSSRYSGSSSSGNSSSSSRFRCNWQRQLVNFREYAATLVYLTKYEFLLAVWDVNESVSNIRGDADKEREVTLRGPGFLCAVFPPSTFDREIEEGARSSQKQYRRKSSHRVLKDNPGLSGKQRMALDFQAPPTPAPPLSEWEPDTKPSCC